MAADKRKLIGQLYHHGIWKGKTTGGAEPLTETTRDSSVCILEDVL
jgi:hypothetical protein